MGWVLGHSCGRSSGPNPAAPLSNSLSLPHCWDPALLCCFQDDLGQFWDRSPSSSANCCAWPRVRSGLILRGGKGWGCSVCVAEPRELGFGVSIWSMGRTHCKPLAEVLRLSSLIFPENLFLKCSASRETLERGN